MVYSRKVELDSNGTLVTKASRGIPMIILQPVGNIDNDVLQALKESLSLAYCRHVDIGDFIPLTEENWNQQRRQYQAGVLLQALPIPLVPQDRVLGIVDADIYAPQMNFIFGQAGCPTHGR